jgi:hypothetical protein
VRGVAEVDGQQVPRGAHGFSATVPMTWQV